ncbi:alpha/beta fold hydrolase [Nocardioides sediminis]|uniref:alpha/beta fold hydrolase n=1 Tax=Nocardioides sediminis TaxID=433648 RepID=UPI000D2F9F7F|nr:alpha/beta hydrolase [Nocardioides sediminis]
METLRLPDGRCAQLWLGGADDGPVVLFFHGTPDTRWAVRFAEAAALDADVRLLCVNRPGYGLSSPAASTYSSVVDDAVAVLDLLGIGRVAALGMSVGGGYAAAFAARHPDRAGALGVVATLPMPYSGTGTVEEAMDGARPELEGWARDIDVTDPDDTALAGRWAAALPEQDGALVRRWPAADVAASAREALADHHGFLRDAALAFRPWDVDVSAVRCRTHLWYGEADERALPGAAWFRARIPHASLVVRPGATHLATLVGHWPEILVTLTRPEPCGTLRGGTPRPWETP